MIDKLKKKSIQKSMFLIIILLAVGVVLVVLEFSSVKGLLHGKVAFETLAPDEIADGVVVEASIDTNFGAFLEEYETNTNTHISRTTDLYYVIWTGDDDAEDYKFMAIKVPASQEKTMEAIADATYYEKSVTPVTYSGAICKMKSEEYQYFKDYFIDGGWTEEEIEEYTLPYYIKVGALQDGAAVSAYAIMAAGIVLLIIGIWRLVYVATGGCIKTLKKEMNEIGLSEHDADYEYESAKLFNKSNDLRIGKRAVFFVSGSTPHVLSATKLVWAYQKNTTHRTNGVKTGTTYEIIFNTYEKKRFQVSVPNEKTGQEILQYIIETMPWTIIGYSDDLNKLYQRDYQNFLAARYNQVPHDPYAGTMQNGEPV